MQIARKLGNKACWASMLAAILVAGAAPARSSEAAAEARPGAAAAAVHPVSGLPVIDLTVTHARRGIGHIRHFRVEVAATPEQQVRGLMFRTAMAADEGMIFPMTNGRPAAFWMKNTVIPLDIIFIDLNGRIANIAANARPYDERPLPSVGPVSGVLELNGGRAAALGIGPGDPVKW